MSFLECSLCEEIITAPQFYKGAAYGSSCIHKAIAMDVPNAGQGPSKKVVKPKATGDIYMSFLVDSSEEVTDTHGRVFLRIRSSEFGKGYFDLKNWWGDGMICNFGKSVVYNNEKNIIIVNFGNPNYNKHTKKYGWKWDDRVLKRHSILIYEPSTDGACGKWIFNKNLSK